MALVCLDETQLNPDQFRDGRSLPLREPAGRRTWYRRSEIGESQMRDAAQQLGIVGDLQYLPAQRDAASNWSITVMSARRPQASGKSPTNAKRSAVSSRAIASGGDPALWFAAGASGIPLSSIRRTRAVETKSATCSTSRDCMFHTPSRHATLVECAYQEAENGQRDEHFQ
jgi:hypothetical protein